MSRKKDNIVVLATHLIQKKGFLAISYDDIGKYMNVTKAAIHHHFEKKEDLGIAICEALQNTLQKNYEESYEEVVNQQGHPWCFFEKIANGMKKTDICPITSLQTDYADLPISMQKKLVKISKTELELFTKLIEVYSKDTDANMLAARTLMSMKGAFQYRRVAGDDFYKQIIETIKVEFYASLDFHNNIC